MLGAVLLQTVSAPGLRGTARMPCQPTRSRAPLSALRASFELHAEHATGAAVAHADAHAAHQADDRPRVEVVVAGGGIGGLCTALVLTKLGYDVRVSHPARKRAPAVQWAARLPSPLACPPPPTPARSASQQVFEKTTSYRPFGGPIQIASNAAESIRRIDEGVYEKIVARATCIGDRTNGLKDGLSDEWFATFDLDSPARKRGQAASMVIDRPILQEILLEKVGNCVTKGSEVMGCEQVGDRIRVGLSTGETVEADLLVGSDGIKSRVRDLFDPSQKPPVWSGYTCVAGMAYCVPPDIKEVGYKVRPRLDTGLAPLPSRTPSHPLATSPPHPSPPVDASRLHPQPLAGPCPPLTCPHRGLRHKSSAPWLPRICKASTPLPFHPPSPFPPKTPPPFARRRCGSARASIL